MAQEGVKFDLDLRRDHLIWSVELRIRKGWVCLRLIILFRDKKENLECIFMATVILFITIETQALLTTIRQFLK